MNFCCYFLVTFSLISTILCINEVPLLLWSSDSSPLPLPRVSSLHTVTAPEFKSDFLEKIELTNPFVIFLQDTLSVEDFSIYGNAYGAKDQPNSFENVAKLVSSSSSVMLPSVEDAENSLLTLVEEKGATVLTDGDYVLPAEEKSIIVVHLPATADTDRAKSLSKNDKIISNVLQEVSSRYPKYTSVYTASHSDWADALEDPEPSYLNRHILAAELAVNATVYPGVTLEEPNCILLYTEEIVVFLKEVSAEGVSTELGNYTLVGKDITTSIVGDCNTTDYQFKISYVGGNFTSLTITMSFELDKRNDWYLRNMTVQFTMDTGITGNNPLDTHDIWAPVTFSYHCNDDYFKAIDQPSTTLHHLLAIKFEKIQLQPFKVSGNVFGEPWDCVGFFTIGIWMGILVTLIMIVSLGFGITALASIHTNDRFDDPKGKPLIINISE